MKLKSRPEAAEQAKDTVPVLPRGAEVVPGHEVVELLSRGHRLDVYDAWSLPRRCRCVVKVVRPDRITEPHTAVLLRREGQVLRDLAHPHLVRAYEVIEHPQIAVVLETLTGPTLSGVLDHRKRVIPQDVVLIGAQVGSALQLLHDHATVHGDITVNNIVIEGAMAKVIDLSLSGPPGPVRAGSGTRGYRAPEQTAGTIQTPATDVWGLGAVLHAALTGRTHDDPAGPDWRDWWRTARPGMARQLAEVIGGCLHPDPDQRWTLHRVTGTLEELVPLR